MPIVHRLIGEVSRLREVSRIYSDGGICGQNPSPRGGSWGFRMVSREGEPVYETAGTTTPAEVGLPWISCNLMEYLAILIALENLPEGMGVTVCSDSHNAIVAYTQPRKPRKYIPDDLLARRAAALGRLGHVSFVQLAGHPTRKDLMRGFKACKKRTRLSQRPVSEHNVHVDRLCTEAAARLA